MKTAFSAMCIGTLLFFSRGVVLAAETDQYDFSSMYEVKSAAGGSKSSFSSGDHLEPVRSHGTEITPEAGHEGKPNIADLTNGALLAKQEVDKSMLETFTEELTDSSKSVLQTFLTSIVIPAEVATLLSAGIHKASNAVATVITSAESSFSSFYSHLQSQVYSSSFKAVISLSKTINSFTSSVVTAVSSTRSSISKHIPHNYKVAGTLMIMAIPFLVALAAKTPSGKLFSLVGQALLSVVDLLLHGLSAGAAVIQMFTTSLTFKEAYLENKSWIKRKSGRDIGTPGHDVLYGVPVIALAVLLIYSAPISAKVAQVAPRIIPFIQLNAKPLAAYTAKVLQETSRECEIPGQCGTETDLAITLGVNTLAQGLPLEGPAVAFKKSLNTGEEALEDSRVLSKTALTNGDDVIEESTNIGKALTNTDDIVLAFNRNDLEKRVGKDFVEEVFGNTQGKDFEQIAKKWPKALEFLNESTTKGHVVLKHVAKDNSFIIDRVTKEGYKQASTFNSYEDMLDSVESTLSKVENQIQIKNWLNNPSKTSSTLSLTYSNDKVIGRYFEQGQKGVINVKNVLVVLKKDIDNYYILTAYAQK